MTTHGQSGEVAPGGGRGCGEAGERRAGGYTFMSMKPRHTARELLS